MKGTSTLILAINIILLASTYVYSQPKCDTLQWMNANPYPITYNCVKFLDDQNDVAVGDHGGIIRSSNKGNTWIAISSPTNRTLYNLFFINSASGFAVGDSVILKTSDTGLTWVELNININDVFREIIFTPNGNSFMAGLGGIYKSTDGGKTWNKINDTGSNSINFPSDNIGYSSETSGIIIKTIDGGNTWQKVKDYQLSHTLSTLKFVNDTVGFAGYVTIAMGYSTGGTFKTVNGGLTWTDIFTGTAVKSIFLKDTNNLYLAGGYGAGNYSGSIQRSRDGGKSFSPAYNTVLLNAIDFHNGNGVAVGYAGFIITSNDADSTWMASNQPITTDYHRPVNISSISFLNDTLGIASSNDGCPVAMCNNRGSLFRTVDGGKNWSETYSGGPLKSVVLLDKNKAFAGGSGFLKSTDGGQSWTIVDYIKIGSIFFLNESIGFAGGNNSILKTLNGGDNWQDIKSTFSGGGFYITDIYFINDKEGFAISYGSLFSTKDGGNSWLSVITPYNNCTKVQFLDANLGYIITEGGGIYKTNDAGKTWDFYKINNYTLHTISYKGNSGIASSETGNIFITTDQGINWKTETLPLYIGSFNTIDFVKATNTVYLGNNEGQILKIPSCSTPVPDNTTSLFNHTRAIPDFAIYPNPNQGTFTLQLKDASQVRIFNNFGNEVKALTISPNDQGENIYLNRILSGIYYVEVTSDKGRSTQKLIVE
jgi:photosystem II stability/assembly factor-like uncharacterized protein